MVPAPVVAMSSVYSKCLIILIKHLTEMSGVYKVYLSMCK